MNNTGGLDLTSMAPTERGGVGAAPLFTIRPEEDKEVHPETGNKIKRAVIQRECCVQRYFALTLYITR